MLIPVGEVDWWVASGTQGPGGAQVRLGSGMQTQPHHHLPNITTFGGK